MLLSPPLPSSESIANGLNNSKEIWNLYDSIKLKKTDSHETLCNKISTHIGNQPFHPLEIKPRILSILCRSFGIDLLALLSPDFLKKILPRGTGNKQLHEIKPSLPEKDAQKLQQIADISAEIIKNISSNMANNPFA